MKLVSISRTLPFGFSLVPLLFLSLSPTRHRLLSPFRKPCPLRKTSHLFRNSVASPGVDISPEPGHANLCSGRGVPLSPRLVVGLSEATASCRQARSLFQCIPASRVSVTECNLPRARSASHGVPRHEKNIFSISIGDGSARRRVFGRTVQTRQSRLKVRQSAPIWLCIQAVLKSRMGECSTRRCFCFVNEGNVAKAEP